LAAAQSQLTPDPFAFQPRAGRRPFLRDRLVDYNAAMPAPDLPSPHAEPERYQGRPLLIVLENYVLDCIGKLPPESSQKLAGLMQKALGGGPDWKQTLREMLHLDPSMDEELRKLWIKNEALAKQDGTLLHPVQFAKMVVDENFAELIGKPQV